jgi:hypothetical protein
MKTLKYEEFTATNTGIWPKRGAKSALFWRRSTTENGFIPLLATCRRRSSKTSSERLREHQHENDRAFFQADTPILKPFREGPQ